MKPPSVKIVHDRPGGTRVECDRDLPGIDAAMEPLAGWRKSRAGNWYLPHSHNKKPDAEAIDLADEALKAANYWPQRHIADGKAIACKKS